MANRLEMSITPIAGLRPASELTAPFRQNHTVKKARRVALEMIRKLRQEDPSVAQDRSGWRIIADTTGSVVLAIDLDSVA
jgi:hypothetical protein